MNCGCGPSCACAPCRQRYGRYYGLDAMSLQARSPVRSARSIPGTFTDIAMGNIDPTTSQQQMSLQQQQQQQQQMNMAAGAALGVGLLAVGLSLTVWGFAIYGAVKLIKD